MLSLLRAHQWMVKGDDPSYFWQEQQLYPLSQHVYHLWPAHCLTQHWCFCHWSKQSCHCPATQCHLHGCTFCYSEWTGFPDWSQPLVISHHLLTFLWCQWDQAPPVLVNCCAGHHWCWHFDLDYYHLSFSPDLPQPLWQHPCWTWPGGRIPWWACPHWPLSMAMSLPPP